MTYSIGIDLGGTTVKIALVDIQGTIRGSQVFATANHPTAESLVDMMATSIRALCDECTLDVKNVKGIGIGTPGVPDPKAGQIRYAVNLKHLNDFHICPALLQRTGIAAFIENDANAMALAELHYGAAQGKEQVIGITLGTGVGGGIIINGKLYRGANYAAGEIGHITIESNGLLCTCGNYGCLERYVNKEGIINRFNASFTKGIPSTIADFCTSDGITPLAIANAAQAKDLLACEVMEETGRFLGIGLASLVNIFNPQLIVIGGGIANAGEVLFGPARREMVKRAYPLSSRDVRIVAAHFKNDAGVIGAAAVARDNMR